jgi:thiol-disulfide isomerase/thioredoxin
MTPLRRLTVFLSPCCFLLAVAPAVTATAAGVEEQARPETVLAAKAAQNEGLNQVDDPALERLGTALVRFIRTRDVKAYEAGAMLTSEAAWELMEKRPADQRPAREEFEKAWSGQRERILAPARLIAEQMKNAGVDLESSTIQVKEISCRKLFARAGANGLDGLQGEPLTAILAVRSDGISRTGQSLSGEYILAAGQAMRIGDRWFITRGIHWQQFPEGVLEATVLADIQLENYVAEKGTLPPGTPAPDAEVVRVNDEQKLKLSELRGKVVVLDFWATWCAPCQEPMARMQQYGRQHPDWENRVKLVSLSIDDSLKLVQRHLERRGWTNTFNLWAGPGGWVAEAAKAYRVSGVPTCYVIDAQGIIVLAGQSASLEIGKCVDQLLGLTRPPTKP